MKLDFSTKKQVVKVNDKYAARYKKWWQLSWRYVGINDVWSGRYLTYCFVLTDTKEQACEKLNNWLPKIEVLEPCQPNY